MNFIQPLLFLNFSFLVCSRELAFLLFVYHVKCVKANEMNLFNYLCLNF